MPNMNPKKSPMPEQEPNVRNKNFEEVALGYTEEMAVEAKRCLNCKNKPCMHRLPVEVEIPGFISTVAEGFRGAAYQVSPVQLLCPPSAAVSARRRASARQVRPRHQGRARRHRPSGALCCRLAPRENDIQGPAPESNGHKVAVIGAGPAGLTCAGDLAKLGYEVTVYEALHAAGGVLMYGIPEFRLPKDIVQQEIERLKELGVEIETNIVVGKS